MLRQVGESLGGLAEADLAVRSRLRRGPDGRAGRKRALTAASSSRWAGAITRTANDQWTRGYMNLQQECASLRAIHRLRQRIQVPVGGKADRVRGYATPGERWAKQRRLQTLSTRLVRVEERLAADRVSVVRGGRRLARTRHHLEVAGLTLERWQQTWAAERLLSCPVSLTYRGDEVAAQAVSGAVRYDITLDSDRQRWHLHASWTVQPAPIPSVDEAVADGVVAVDLNADHLACWTIDRHGNPVGGPVTIPLDFAGLPTSTRDGHLRAAITQVCALARLRGVRTVAIEDLNFADARSAGRDTLGRGRRGKRLRRTISGIPTGRFRDRIVQMAYNQGLWVVAEDPAYTSRWGGRYWQAPLQRRHPGTTVTRHHAACVVIGRRALGLGARRRAGILDGDRRITGASNCRPGRLQPGCVHGPGPPDPAPAQPRLVRRDAATGPTPAEAAQDRSEPPISRK